MSLKRSFTKKLQRLNSKPDLRAAKSASDLKRKATISAPITLLYSTYGGATEPIGEFATIIPAASRGRSAASSPLGTPDLSEASDTETLPTTVSGHSSPASSLCEKRRSICTIASSLYSTQDVDDEDAVSYIESVLDLGLAKYSAEEYCALLS